MIRSSPHSRRLSSARSKKCNTSMSTRPHMTHGQQKSYTWIHAPYKCAPTHRAFTNKERESLGKAVHMAWNKKVNTDRKTLEFPYDVEELIDWESIHIPRRTAQECKDEWCTLFDPYAQPVCLRRDKWFWRIQYYPHFVDSRKKTAGHPAFVYHGIIGTHPHSYLIPHTSTKEVQTLIREKQTQGYEYIHDFAHTGVSYLLYDDLRKMPVGTEFTVGSNSETGSPSGKYGIRRVKVKEHFEHYTDLYDAEKPSQVVYQLFRGSLKPPSGGWSSSKHSTFAAFYSTLAVYTDHRNCLHDKHSVPRISQRPAFDFFHPSLKSTRSAKPVYPLVVYPNPQDPIYGHEQSLIIQRFMKTLYASASSLWQNEVNRATLLGLVGGYFGGIASHILTRRLRSRRNRLKPNASRKLRKV